MIDFSKRSLILTTGQAYEMPMTKPIPPTVVREVRLLLKQLHYHSHRYYVLDDPEIPDAEYDRLYDRLLELEEQYPKTVALDSPTQRAGSEPSSRFGHVRHHVPMMSLQKVTTAEAFIDFHERIIKNLDGLSPSRFLMISPRLHGHSPG